MSDAPPPLHLPEGQRYSCVRCGMGCHLFNEYPLDLGAKERLERLGAEDLLPSEQRGGGFWERGVVDPSKYVLRRRGGDRACVFLRPDQLCAVHAAHGLEAKPRACQDFPYRFVETPLGIYPGLSFACTAVLENEGEALTSQGEALRGQFAVSGAVTRKRDPVRFTNRHHLHWEAWAMIEEQLAALLRVPDVSVGEALAAQSVLLDLFRNLIGQARRDPATGAEADKAAFPPFAPDHGGVSDVETAGAMARSFATEEGRARLLALARKAKGSPALQRSLTGLVASFRGALDAGESRPSRARVMARIFSLYMGRMLGMGRLRLPGLPDSFSSRDLHTVSAAEGEPGNAALLRRYFEHALFRKDLPLARTAWIGQRWQLLHHALIRSYARGEAVIAGVEHADVGCYRRAIRNVEKYFVFHGGFQRLFDHYPAFGLLLDAAVAKPVYAASMILDPNA